MDDLYKALIQMAVIVNREQASVLEIAVFDGRLIAHLVPASLWYELNEGGDDSDYEEDDDEYD